MATTTDIPALEALEGRQIRLDRRVWLVAKVGREVRLEAVKPERGEPSVRYKHSRVLSRLLAAKPAVLLP